MLQTVASLIYDTRVVNYDRNMFIMQTLVAENGSWFVLMEQHALENVNNCLNTNIYYYLETSGGQHSNLYLNVVHFFDDSVN
jgi:hypothetical protein